MKARDVMTAPVVTVDSGASLTDVFRALIDNDISGLPVVNETGTLVGIVTEADLVGRRAYPGSRPRFLRVVVDSRASERPRRQVGAGVTANDVKTPFPGFARPDDDVERRAQRMLEHGIKRIPVQDHGRLVGIVTRHDILRVFDRSDRAATG